MKTQMNNTTTFNAKHEHCKRCLIENACNVYKHYKTLKDKNLNDSATLLCFVANLDHYAMKLHETLSKEKINCYERLVKILFDVYGNTLGFFWRRYNENDIKKLNEKEKRSMHIYIYDVLDKYEIVEYFEEKLGFDLTTQYNDYFVDATVEEYKKYAK